MYIIKFYKTLYYFYRYDSIDCPYFDKNEYKDDILIHLYNIYLTFKLWDLPHYRNKTYGKDIYDNFYNLYIPYTGISLYYLVYTKYIALFSILVLYPIISIYYYFTTNLDYSKKILLHPYNWFWIWRINCNLVHLTHTISKSKQYKYENKKIFLEKCVYLNIPVTSCIYEDIILKNTNIEGGMGIHLYNNCFNNGDWIIQRKLTNSLFLQSFLPKDSPLSTLRVITYKDKLFYKSSKPHILSACLRAGLTKQKTDHTSILFNINIENGKIGKGTMNEEWYGKNTSFDDSDFVSNIALLKFDQNIRDKLTYHPEKGVNIDRKIPKFDKIKKICTNAHLKLLNDIPIVGWDIGLTKEEDIVILEINISCNLFCANYNKQNYYKFLKTYYI